MPVLGPYSIVGANCFVEVSLLEGSLIGSDVKVRGAFRQLHVGDSTAIAIHL